MSMKERSIYSTPVLTFYAADVALELELPFVSNGIKAGFPSPALDFMGEKIDLNRILIKHPMETFYAQVDGDSMKDAGIHDGDIMVVDRSMPHEDGKIFVCYLDGEFTVKRMKIDTANEIVWLVAENDAYPPIKITKENDFIVWGRVVRVIKSI
jgi:DNA polymerase V